MMYPGNQFKAFDTESNVDTYTNENDVYGKFKNFTEKFFERMQLKEDFVRKAQKILHVITKTHQKKHKVANQVENLPKAENSNYVYVGIHCRRTDHIEYEKKHQMMSLDAMG